MPTNVSFACANGSKRCCSIGGDFWIHSWEVMLVGRHAGGAARMHLMLSPVVRGAQEEIIHVTHRSTSSYSGI